MGSCFSAIDDVGSAAGRPTTAKVVTVDGCLTEYTVPATVAQVLRASCVSGILCSSDGLSYNDHIHALSAKETIELGQLYFVLPMERLERALSAHDMAALAVKASAAIEGVRMSRRRRESVEIVPLHDADEYRSVNEFSVRSIMSSRLAQRKTGGMKHVCSSRERLGTIEEAA